MQTLTLLRVVFIVVALAIFLFMNFYIYRRFLSRLSFLNTRHPLFIYAFYTLFAMEALFLALMPFGLLRGNVYALFASIVGITFMLFAISLLYDLLHTGLHSIPFERSRRESLKIILDVTMLILALTYIVKGFFNARKPPRIRRVPVRIEHLEKGFCILHLSDLHLGPVTGRKELERIVDLCNRMDPDMVVITGDLVDLPAQRVGDMLVSLKRLKQREGIFFVPGNHEYFHGAEAIMAHLEKLGITVLRNENRKIASLFNLCGTLDLMGERLGYLEPDLPAACAGIDPKLPTVLLAHQPKIVTHLRNEPIDLILCGHTHGGQIFPFGLLVLLDQPYLSGLYRHNEKTQVFVTNGTGYWGPPARLLAPSEIVMIDLIPKKPG